MTCEDAPAKLWVNGKQIPIINTGLGLEMRKEGPADINRMADVRIPVEWHDGADHSYLVDEGFFKDARIEVRDGVSGEDVTVLHGHVTSVGGGADSANTMRLRVAGPEQFLSEIDITVSTGAGGGRSQEAGFVKGIKHVLDTVVELFNAQSAYSGVDWELQYSDNEFLEAVDENIVQTQVSHQRFTRNRHTLVDALEWVAGVLDGFYYFEQTEDAPKLIIDDDPTKEFDATADDSDLRLRNNNALAELRPINAIEAIGKTRKDVPIIGIEMPWGGDEFPAVKLKHPKLVERAGEEYVRRIEPDTGSLKATENTARRRFKKMLDDPSGGELEFSPAPKVTPYDKISAVPACNESINADVAAIDYEVERLRHVIRGDQDEPWRTEVEGSLYVDMDNIEVVHSKMVPTEKRTQHLTGVEEGG